MIGRGAVSIAVGCLLLLGCASAIGGWDVEALVVVEPGITRIPGQRIGDMTPYPALRGEELLLVACRYASGEKLSVRGSGPGWPKAWAEEAVEAVSHGIEGVELELEFGESSPGARLEIISVEAANSEGPKGLGDTLAECDVSETDESTSGLRGRLVRSEIRMRRARFDIVGRERWASQEEWVGALMHELGHALGFAGHVVYGDSLVLLEQSRLRALGRRAVSKKRFVAPNLTALYAISPGRVLGTPELTVAGRLWLKAVAAYVAARELRVGAAATPRASVGDRAARIVWHWATGDSVELIFPFWRRELRSGEPITVVPSAGTRKLMDQAT
jgi:hypothetical protein